MSFLNSHHPMRRVKSVKYAFEGIFHALINEANFRIQAVIVLIAIIAGAYYHISNVEWALLVISLGTLLSAEMINTVVEELIDHFFKDINPVAKIVKDLASGFVLITALSTLTILILIFGSRFI